MRITIPFKLSSKLALMGLLFVCASCETFSWAGSGSKVDPEAAARGVKDVATLKRDYDSQRYWAFWRKNWDGTWETIGRDLHDFHRSFDRHALNYDWDDPTLGY